jgi:3-hydroxyacyl-CoA dehydrogenase
VDVNNRVAIVGAGLIGRSWAIVFAAGGFEVALYDVSRDAVDTARVLVGQGLRDLGEHGLLDDPQAALARVRAAADLANALHGAVLVQENLPERIENKRAIFSELDQLAAPEAILASSTSTIVASLFTEDLKGRHRCLVAHPVNPPHLVPLVELVGAPWTAPATIDNAPAGISDYCRRYGASLSALSAADPAIYEGDNLARILSQWGEASRADQVAARMRWRDRRLAALRAHQRLQPAD